MAKKKLDNLCMSCKWYLNEYMCPHYDTNTLCDTYAAKSFWSTFKKRLLELFNEKN